jgi:hypothetical protein
MSDRTGPPTSIPLEVRKTYACKVCGNYPDEDGFLDHGRGCYMIDENGGGSEHIDMDYHPAPQPASVRCCESGDGDYVSVKALHALGLPEGADVAEWVASLNQQVDGWQRTMRNLIRSTGETPSDVAKKAAVAILETLARWKSAMGEAGRLNFYVNVPLDSDQLAKIIDAHFTLLFEQHKQALHAAEARAREAEGERETYRRAWIRSDEHITALQAESAALAERIRGIADQWAATSHAPTGEAYLVTKTEMANELKQVLAAQLAAEGAAQPETDHARPE